MAIDFFRIFRACFVCKNQDRLKRVERNHSPKFSYFHENCLRAVLSDAMRYSNKIIHDAIRISKYYDEDLEYKRKLSKICESNLNSLDGIKDQKQIQVDKTEIKKVQKLDFIGKKDVIDI
jgi:hypothetical protein